MRKWTIFGILAAATCTQVQAADVFFQGDVSSICVLAAGTPGNLVPNSDGYLASVLPSTVAILTSGGNSLKIVAPVWDQTPTTPNMYTQGGETFEYSYLGLAGAGIAASGFKSTESILPLPALPLSVLTMNARVKSPTAFVDGTYRLKVEVSCVPSTGG